jgi:putative aldouronate transport system permease protein
MSKHKTATSGIFDTFNIFLLSLLALITLYPFLYVLFASFSDPVLLYGSSKIVLWPRGFNLSCYSIVFKNPMVWIGYKNTLIYTVVGTVINMVFTMFGAYALSRKYLPGRTIIMKMVIFTMFFSGGMIPSYLLVMHLGMIDTVWAMVLPGAINAMNLIIMRTNFLSIPAEMEESAKMDGANDFVILFNVILPLARPVIAVILLFYVVRHWNSYFDALIYLQKRENYPLQIVLRDILVKNDIQMIVDVRDDRDALSENIRYSLIMVASLPILFLYPFLQKYFIKGVMIGSIKG